MFPVRLASFAFALAVPIPAQTPPPFVPVTTFQTLALSGVAGTLDLNRDGSLDVLTPGFLISTAFATMDEHGERLAMSGMGPQLSVAPGAFTLSVPIAMAGGDLDADGYEDLVAITSVGRLHWLRNLGATGIGEFSFAPDVVVDSYAAVLPANPPFVRYSFPKLEVCDVDGDGHLDILACGGLADSWGGVAGQGLVCVYLGDGAGGFQAHQLPLAGVVVDAEWADLDGDGTGDHLVVLEEQGAVGIFFYEVRHIALQAGGLVETVASQPVVPGRCTALEIGDFVGDANPDYVIAHAVENSSVLGAAVTCWAGDGQGHLGAVTYSAIPPPLPNAISEFVCSLQVDDFDRDGHLDFVALRGSLQIGPTSLANAMPGDGDLLVSMGPNAFANQPVSMPLGASVVFSNVDSNLYALRPLVAEPDALRTVDLGRDRITDLMVSGLRTIGTVLTTEVGIVRNVTPPLAGDPGFRKVGYASGGVPGRLARIGFDGGLPVVGNQDFACTIQNVQGGCLVGLMWGPWAQLDLGPTHGFMLHMAPTHFGYAGIAQGTQFDDGFFSYALPIPNDPALIGDAGYFQYNYYDHVAGVFGGTQATGVCIGQ